MELHHLSQDGADEASRLEAALERIARASARVPAPAAPAIDTRELAARLDVLIEELRGLLGQA
jgi:hypothetical protein